jgi:pSer/pThr/pTyr-binding forkhead associated (FHA) protein
VFHVHFSAAAIAFLVAEVLEVPYPLAPGDTVTIGRSTDNTIVIPLPSVSRQHAALVWGEGGFEIHDLGSTNGTYVNGESVLKHQLQESDSIRIGPVELIFGANIVECLPRSIEQDTTHDFGLRDSPSSFAGTLGDLGPDQVWQTLELGQKTGRLLLRQGRMSGAIFFESGRPVHAEVGLLRGEEAALSLLALRAGTFRFLPTACVDGTHTILRPSASILLEAARRADERIRATTDAA